MTVPSSVEGIGWLRALLFVREGRGAWGGAHEENNDSRHAMTETSDPARHRGTAAPEDPPTQDRPDSPRAPGRQKLGFGDRAKR
jgi:hypothetical protein